MFPSSDPELCVVDILYRMIKESGLKILAFDGLDEAAETAVRVSL
jgi:hypothetical protein